MTTPECWTITDLQEALVRFEADARRAGLADNSINTYVDRAARFVRWLAGDYQFQGPHAPG
jgi:hypothetical protein